MRLHISLSRKIAVGFSLALLILMAIGAVSYRSAVQFAESADIVARSHQIVATLEAAFGDLANAESEARGYVLTGNKSHLNLYRRYAAEAAVGTQRLRALAMDPTVRERLVSLDDTIQRRLDRLKLSVETRKLEGLEAASKLAGPGKQLMDDVRHAVDAIEVMEKNLLDERHRVAKSLAAQTIVVVILGSFLAVLVAGASTIILRADIAHRERLEKEVMEISEREQRRIGQDLHDGLCQRLTGIALFNRSVQQKLAAKSLAEANESQRVTEMINSSIEEARRLTHGLQPVPDEPTGLMIALRELTVSTHALSKLTCHFDCPTAVAVPDRAAATHLFRIAQEAMHNALRHANAANITIALRGDEETITLTVSDDGRGLPDHQPRRGMGLEIMDYRAHTIGATLTVRRGEKCGTTVCCTLRRAALNPIEASA